MGSLSTLGQAIANILLGTLIIDRYGRRPIMLLGLLSFCLLVGFFGLTYQLSHIPFYGSPVQIGLLFFMITSAMANSFSPASIAMAVDIIGVENTAELGTAMTLLNVFKTLGVLGGFIGGYFILAQDLEDYTTVWLFFFILSCVFLLVAAVFLRETVSEHTKNSTSDKVCAAIYADMRDAFRIVWNDPFIRLNAFITNPMGYMAAYGAVTMSGGWALSICGYSQATASLMGVVQPSFIVIGSLSCAFMIPVIGPYYTNFIGLALSGLGAVIVGLGAFFKDWAPLLYWIGYGGVLGLGMGVSTPCLGTILSPRVAFQNQGKLFALTGVFATGGAMFGTFVWSNFLFQNDGRDTDLQLATAWFVSGALYAVTFFGGILLYVVYIVPEQRLAAAAPHTQEGLLNAEAATSSAS